MSLIKDLIKEEADRQEREICLIASENYVSKNVLEAQGSILTNKYAEGYPKNRYYGGCEVVDEIEDYAIQKLKALFGCKYANVQPHSGSQANQAVYNALLKPGETILSMSLDAGGHLTHGAKVSSSGKNYKIAHYGLNEDGYIDCEEIKSKLYEHLPALLIVGGSAYSRQIDFEAISKVVKEYNERMLMVSDSESCPFTPCVFMVDMAHIAGLVAAGVHPSPIYCADVVTSTTHKTLRGPRGGFILTNNEDIAKLIDKSVFPGIQGGPLMHVIAAKAVCFEEASLRAFKFYQSQVIKNAKYMADKFSETGVKMVSGGTDNHLILIDLSEEKFSGQEVESKLKDLGIIVNKNKIFGDKRSAKETSGIRIGVSAVTSRDFSEHNCKTIASIISKVIKDTLTNEEFFEHKRYLRKLCKDFPIYKNQIQLQPTIQQVTEQKDKL